MILKTRNFKNPLRGNICNHLSNEIVDQFWTEYYDVPHKKKRFVFFSVHRYSKYIRLRVISYLIFNSIARRIRGGWRVQENRLIFLRASGRFHY